MRHDRLSIPAGARRRRPRVLLAGALLVLGAPVAAQVATVASSSAGTSSIDLSGAATGIKIAGDSWLFSVTYETLDSPTVEFSLLRTTSGGSEIHLWSVPVSASDFSWSASSGVARLDTGSQADPIGSADVTFTKTGSKSLSCTSGSETDYSGKMSGKAELVTGLSGGGTVGSTTKTLTFDDETVLKIDNGCVTNTDYCTASLIWSSVADANGTVEADGGNLGAEKTYFAGAIRETTLSKPAGSSRDDIIEATTKAPTFNGAKTTLSITTTAAGLLTGSGTISGGSKRSGSYPCSYDGKKVTVKTVTISGATWTSHSFVGHAAIGGNLVPATKGSTAGVISSST